jgi:hypothetical protein
MRRPQIPGQTGHEIVCLLPSREAAGADSAGELRMAAADPNSKQRLSKPPNLSCLIYSEVQ